MKSTESIAKQNDTQEFARDEESNDQVIQLKPK